MSKILLLAAQAVNNNDMNALSSAAHSLKGASGYVGAGRVHYAAYFIREALLNEN